MTLDQEIEQVRQAAYSIYAPARDADRDLTASEDRELKQLLDRKALLEERRSKQQTRAARLSQIEQVLQAPVAEPGSGEPPAGGQRRSLGARFVESASYAQFRQSFPAGIPEGVHVNIPPAMLPARSFTANVGRAQTRANEITTGLYPIPPQFQQYPQAMLPPATPTPLTDLVTHAPVSVDAVAFPQLNAWTYAAAPVAELASKPQAAISWVLKTRAVETFASWIAVTKQALADRPQLQALIDTFLTNGVDIALETAITTDIVSQAPVMAAPTGTPTIVDVARHALAVLQGRFVQPTAFVFNPVDAEAIDLLKDGMERYYGAGPFGMGPNTLWGIPRVTSYLMTAPGQALLGDFRYDVFYDRQQDAISASDSHANFFVQNLVAVLGESRGVNGVLWPQAFELFPTPSLSVTPSGTEPESAPERQSAESGGAARSGGGKTR